MNAWRAAGVNPPRDGAQAIAARFSAGSRPPLAMRWLLLAAAALFLAAGCSRPANRVVVYCALDREFADAILDDFAQSSGLEVIKRYDTEANKSIGLYEDLIREADRPRCDVHWNNEILATIRLQKRGVLAAYESPSAKPFPAMFKANDHTWTAFAARARVLIVNTKRVGTDERPRGMEDLTRPEWKGRVAMAKPLFGTTATHAACLFQSWGAEKAKAFYEKLKANEVHIVAGNKQVAVGVAAGQFDAGFTDTDDALIEIEQGKPVTMVYPDAADKDGNGLGTLFIPNTVALIKNCPNPEGAKKLIDYLLTPEVELKLAHSKSRQIPLNPEATGKVPPEVERARAARKLDVDFAEAATAWEESQRFLKDLFAIR